MHAHARKIRETLFSYQLNQIAEGQYENITGFYYSQYRLVYKHMRKFLAQLPEQKNINQPHAAPCILQLQWPSAQQATGEWKARASAIQTFKVAFIQYFFCVHRGENNSQLSVFCLIPTLSIQEQAYIVHSYRSNLGHNGFCYKQQCYYYSYKHYKYYNFLRTKDNHVFPHHPFCGGKKETACTAPSAISFHRALDV